MIKIIVNNPEEEVVNKLRMILGDCMILIKNSGSEIFILTNENRLDFIRNKLTIDSVSEFSEMDKIDHILSKDEYTSLGLDYFK